MADLLNVATGNPETIPDESAYQAFAAGTHTPTNGGRLLISPTGRLVVSPSQDVADNVAKYQHRLPTQDDLNAFAMQQKYGEGLGNEAAAAAAGLARGVTFGASDYLLPKTGITTKEALAERKARNPISSTGSEIVGAVGAALAAPELSLPGRVARGAGAVGEAASGLLGRAATAVTTEGSAASRVLGASADVLGHGLGSAVEGAAYGAGQSVSEAALGDPDLTGEKILSNIGYGALYGGALGTVLHAGAAAIPASIGKAESAIGGFYKKWVGGLEDLPGPLQEGESASQSFVPGKGSRAWAKVSSAVSGEPEDAILAKMAEARNPAGLPMTPAERANFATDLKGSLQDHYTAIDKAAKDAASFDRPQESAEILKGADPTGALTEFHAAKNTIKAAIAEMEAAPELYPARFPAKLRQIADSVEAKNPETAADAFKVINETKQAIDTKIPWGKEITGEAADAVSLVKGLRSVLKDSLEKEDVWGHAAARQAAFNDATNAFLTSKKEFQRRFMYKIQNRSGGVSYKVDPIKVNTWFNQIKDPRGLRSTEALKDYLSTSRSLVKEIGETHAAAPFSKTDPEALGTLIDKNEAETLKAHNVVAKQPGGFGFFSDIYSGAKPVVAYALGGPLGAGATVAAGSFHALKNPGGAIEKLVKLEQASQKASRFIKTASKAAVEVGNEAMKSVPVAGLIGAKISAAERETRFEKRVEEIQQRADPAKALDKTVWATQPGFHAAPRVMGAVQQTALRATAFLASKIPAPPVPKTPFVKTAMKPSQAEIMTFDRYYDAVHDPLSILDGLKSGHVSGEAREAVTTVYPRLFAEMTHELLSNVLASDKMIPYQRRLAICGFIGQPLEESLSPESIALNQTALNKNQAEQEQKEENEKGPVNVANRYKTPFQRSTDEEEEA